MLHGVLRKLVLGQKVGMAVMVAIFYERITEPGNRGAHELTNQTAKVGGHHKGLKAMNTLGSKLAIDEPHKREEFLHALLNMSDGQSVRQDGFRIECVRVNRHRHARLDFSVFLRRHVLIPLPAEFRGK